MGFGLAAKRSQISIKMALEVAQAAAATRLNVLTFRLDYNKINRSSTF